MPKTRAMDPAFVPIGRYPTPVFRADELCTERAELWVKNDGVTHERYGGNKIRKLEYLLAEARRRGARRILTVGAAGSHHVLATTLFARDRDLPVAAVLCPQAWTEHAEQTLRAGLARGLEAHATRAMSTVPLALPRFVRRGDYVIPPGGSNVLGTLGYVRAAEELAAQVRSGELPEPDVIVAPLGSGGTVAGLALGVAASGLGSLVLGVQVAASRPVSEALALGLATLGARRLSLGFGARALRRRLLLDGSELGRGYSWPTERSDAASRIAAGIGLEVDPTYTAKTFAKCLELVAAPGFERGAQSCELGRPERVLYWHTLSAAPLAPLIEQGRAPKALPDALAQLFLRD
jgi:1-aminocyclopropane-1-carboxylate deaminase/D-cysteine desulfhydrase-like pyridoxal-dependent ACC family enzyme